jgi:hypothetical protein
MGIYSSGKIFGIRIYSFNDDDFANILLEYKYDTIMTSEQMREAYLFYSNLNDKNKIHFQIYTECFSTLNYACVNDNPKFMKWEPFPLDLFVKIFNK